MGNLKELVEKLQRSTLAADPTKQDHVIKDLHNQVGHIKDLIIQLEAELKRKDEALREIATPYCIGIYGENKAYSINPRAIKIAEQALKPTTDEKSH